MGDDEDKGYFFSPKPAHQVKLDHFLMGQYPVTQELWEAVMGGNPSHFKGPHRPVETVSWDETQVFLEKTLVFLQKSLVFFRKTLVF